MNGRTTYVAGEGPLTYGRILREAAGMFRQHYLRVAVVALVLFVPPPLLAEAIGRLRDSLESDPGLIRGLGYGIGLLVAVLINLLGPVVYAGYLDQAVGHEYFKGRKLSFGTVMRTLPWGRLLVADLILIFGTVAGLAILVLPGIVWMTLLGLVGPVIVQEHHGVIDGFTRTFRLSRPAWRMILVLVVGFLAWSSSSTSSCTSSSITPRCGYRSPQPGWCRRSSAASSGSSRWRWPRSSWPAIRSNRPRTTDRRIVPSARGISTSMERFGAFVPLYQ